MSYKLNNNFTNLNENEMNEINGGAVVIPILIGIGKVISAGAAIWGVYNIGKGAVSGYKDEASKDTP
ncbi:bacteriocin [Oceanirhabdus sp. W0125-5]|uniref:bacteriocin n=1 Tax=Oceanirhabdus sp. W0125-5 TaxID=2999116 RepID=UPI0022F33AA1|nr:bacteriocin [Oceanirhabdus sp. W0125-5]WBW97676.1 bacteriocin [Oceanirhabdus sp. W0125-5]